MCWIYILFISSWWSQLYKAHFSRPVLGNKGLCNNYNYKTDNNVPEYYLAYYRYLNYHKTHNTNFLCQHNLYFLSLALQKIWFQKSRAYGHMSQTINYGVYNQVILHLAARGATSQQVVLIHILTFMHFVRLLLDRKSSHLSVPLHRPVPVLGFHDKPIQNPLPPYPLI